MKEFKKWLENKIHNQRIYVECCQSDGDVEEETYALMALDDLQSVYDKFIECNNQTREAL